MSAISSINPPTSLGGSPSELQNQIVRDMERLRRISAHLSSARSWADQYEDEASALSALAKGAALAHATSLLGSIDRPSGWNSAAFGLPASGTLGVAGLEESQTGRDPINYSAPTEGPDMPDPTAMNEPTPIPHGAPPNDGIGDHAGSDNGPHKSHRDSTLRQRFIQAQKALDERARKLKEALSRERERLKAVTAADVSEIPEPCEALAMSRPWTRMPPSASTSISGAVSEAPGKTTTQCSVWKGAEWISTPIGRSPSCGSKTPFTPRAAGEPRTSSRALAWIRAGCRPRAP